MLYAELFVGSIKKSDGLKRILPTNLVYNNINIDSNGLKLIWMV
jgi:hypothetical protein